ncbi:ATP-binding protein [Knoellia sp. CPCC 206450]|uniref:ATP-binding protein n=1 Tax=Knoellia tibetensis TaxID=3404798 RepID=UPI003B434A89
MDLESLFGLSPSHQERLQWFLDRAGAVTGWPTQLSDGSFLVTRPKGIFKPRDLSYALSIRIQASSPYADGEVHHRGDGSWYFAYHQEGEDPDLRDREYANVGLVECMKSGVPVGVLRQVDKYPPKPVKYDVLGLAVPVWWEDGYFFLEGLPPSGLLRDIDLPEVRRVIREAATSAKHAARAAQDAQPDQTDAVAPHDYPDRRSPASVDVERVELPLGHNAMSDAVSIRPGVAMLGLFPHMKYEPWYALGELVDNGIQSYLSNRDRLRDAEPDYRLRIEIEIDKTQGGTIVVRDNAAGIAHGDWHRAFLVAEPPTDATGLSQFGVGMKAACCWFAKNWSLRTSHLGEEIIRSVSFDIPEIVATRDETLAVIDEPTDWRTHFTEIRMSNLYRTPQTKTQAKIKEYLGAIYRQFLRNGDVELLFNGDPITFQEHPVLTAPLWSDPGGEPITWRKDVDLRLDSGRRVKGFVSIREKGATRSAGLALFYRNKVVTGAGEDTYRPEEIFGRSNDFRSQRVFGELHMDDFNVTYTKDALVWYDEEEEFIEALRVELEAAPKPLLRQAKEYRSRQVDPAPTDLTGEMIRGIAEALRSGSVITDIHDPLIEMDVEDPYLHGESQETDAGNVPNKQPSSDEVVQVDQDLDLAVLGEVWRVELRLVSDEGNSNWLSVLPDQSGAEPRLTLTVNQAHPFMRAYCELPGQELEPVWRVAVALGLGQELARRSGAKQPGLVTMHVNNLLRDILSKKV